MVQLPAGATQERTQKVLDKVRDHYLINEKEAVDAIFAVAGFSFAGTRAEQRHGLCQAQGLERAARSASVGQGDRRPGHGAFSQYPGRAWSLPLRRLRSSSWAPPPASIFSLQDRGGLGHEKLMEARNQLLGMAAKNPDLMAVRPNGQDDTPEFNLDID